MLSVKDKPEKVGGGQVEKPKISNQEFLFESCLLHPQLFFNVFCDPKSALDIQRDRYCDCKPTFSF